MSTNHLISADIQIADDITSEEALANLETTIAGYEARAKSIQEKRENLVALAEHARKFVALYWENEDRKIGKDRDNALVKKFADLEERICTGKIQDVKRRLPK
jgi:hypothetical protein